MQTNSLVPTSWRSALWSMRGVAAFSIAYALVASIATTRTSNSEFLLYIGVMVVLFALVAWLQW